MPLLTRDDLRRHSPLAWASLLALLAMAAWFWTLHKGNAAGGTALAALGCFGLILPPRERMAALPRRLRALPRRLDAVPALASLVSSPGYGLNWFYGENPYDEVVHLVSGGLAGAVFLALLTADGRPRDRLHLILAAALFGVNLGTIWEAFEYGTHLIGDWTDTWTDVALTTFGAALAGLRHPRA
ncbi:hypothetical protein [Roseomonas indoligenes]|uniref:Uncharacterized protein n=1 Tax=Roseomonas indoligenes TaxID=2820811 RepID=A0A940MVZ1_9PROT|nr:hypothetical protein [Pararoseomonas indoligenes]MBP0492698.1 hypothetical protein [Pararoseomonas indoligenes]